MRRRSIVFVLIGSALFGLALVSVIQLYPKEPCRGVDCGIVLFALLPHLIGTLLGALCLAAGTFEFAEYRRQAVRLVWYPGWGFLCGCVIGTYATVFSSSFPAGFYWLPVVVGGVVGVLREIWSWNAESAR